MNHSDWFSIVASVIGGLATLLMGMLVTILRNLRNDFRRFMAEHLYLLRIADWTKVNLGSVFDHLHLTPTEPPPVLPVDQRKGWLS